MTARLVTSHAKVTIIQCYSPPNDHEQQLQVMVCHMLCHDITIVISDMNAQIGGDRSGFEQVLGHMHMESAWKMATISLGSVA